MFRLDFSNFGSLDPVAACKKNRMDEKSNLQMLEIMKLVYGA